MWIFQFGNLQTEKCPCDIIQRLVEIEPAQTIYSKSFENSINGCSSISGRAFFLPEGKGERAESMRFFNRPESQNEEGMTGELSKHEMEILMTTEFNDLNLETRLVETVAALNYQEPTDVQAGVIPLMLDGKDVIAQSQTGSGKTAAFALPILQDFIFGGSHRAGSDTRVDTDTRVGDSGCESDPNYGQSLHVQVMAVYGGQHYGTSKRRIKNGVDVIVGTPGRLQDLMRQKIINLGGVRTVILDEADEMLSMGFVEDIENILRETPAQRQTTLFSATIPAPIRRIADNYMMTRSPSPLTANT